MEDLSRNDDIPETDAPTGQPAWIREELARGFAVSPGELRSKFFGVSPSGKRPVVKPMMFLFQVIGLIVFEIGIWAIYRGTTAPYFEGFGTYLFFLAHIIAAPTIHLVPILIWWYFIRKERSFPIRLTSKRLFSGLLIGFGAALLWRVLEMVVFDITITILGAGELHAPQMINVMDAPGLTLLMTFVMFFVVGPVEEFEFRGFVQDQSARVVPLWAALTISSIMFGCSHIPIAIFVYKFTPPQFAVALFGWITAGFVFGALYMWSRNIWAAIVMHAMGNWILGVFSISMATTTGSGETPLLIAGIVETIVVNAIMIGIFYLLHRFYWNPRVAGSSSMRGQGVLANIDRLVTDLDNRKHPVFMSSGIAAALIVVIMLSITGMSALTGPSIYATPSPDGGGNGPAPADWSLYQDTDGQPQNINGHCDEMSEVTNTVKIDQENVHYVEVTLTWQDEPDQRIWGVRPLDNQPDEFSLGVEAPDETNLSSPMVANAHDTAGGTGTIVLTLEFSSDTAPMLNGTGTYNITVVCGDCGDQTTERPGIFGYRDDGNDWEITVAYRYYQAAEASGE